ncbi:hypothetical protein TSUD_90450 [Trifolium subterraneum]|uniref:Uncharacterized protein n=1 Tax=Trifolium subterraneum TaxID=3900 RepID=A0A2Z6LLR7_TRISU|nr:hypothetical protein TSUD_90450 [Trifolium subterraneum]
MCFLFQCDQSHHQHALLYSVTIAAAGSPSHRAAANSTVRLPLAAHCCRDSILCSLFIT